MPGAPDWGEGVTYLYQVKANAGPVGAELARDKDISLDANSDIAPCLILL